MKEQEQRPSQEREIDCMLDEFEELDSIPEEIISISVEEARKETRKKQENASEEGEKPTQDGQQKGDPSLFDLICEEDLSSSPIRSPLSQAAKGEGDLEKEESEEDLKRESTRQREASKAPSESQSIPEIPANVDDANDEETNEDNEEAPHISGRLFAANRSSQLLEEQSEQLKVRKIMLENNDINKYVLRHLSAA